MSKLNNLSPEKVFSFFDEICAIPRGSGDMVKISNYCLEFAEKYSLRAIKDVANNVVIFKNGSVGYENSEPIILQGHLDIVCQKEKDIEFDFLNDGINAFIDGDFVKARGTTLGADNGIAVAIILSILADDSLQHPPIEAVFTTDEETGMIGAANLNMGILKSKRMINIDAEEDDTITVSCAGGCDFIINAPFERKQTYGHLVTVLLKGLKGGHSGVEINSGRVNANILAGRFLSVMNSECDYEIISVNGGDKGNAITTHCEIQLVVSDTDKFVKVAKKHFTVINDEISSREPSFDFEISISDNGCYNTLPQKTKNELIYTLICAPNGVMEMSADIEGLVETSLNLGILKTEENEITMLFTIRSNKKSALEFMAHRMNVFSECINSTTETSGFYPPWEYVENSKMRELYKQAYFDVTGNLPKVEAIHAGLECSVFSSKIKGLDCIAVGPTIFDVHTINERLSISSTQKVYKLIVDVLKRCK